LSAISAGATQRIALAPDSDLDPAEIFLGCRQQFFALAGAFGSKLGVTADDQPFAREVVGCDARHIALVEQRELQGAAVHQFLDRRGA
jgi:hypothetical protein